MRKTLKISLICLFLANVFIYAQLCPDWDESTHYSNGEKVLYTENGKAYKVIVDAIWYHPPTNTQYWEEIPIMECSECNLTIPLHPGGRVTVDTTPDGYTQTFDWYDGHTLNLTYICGSEITLTAKPYWNYLFKHWYDGTDTYTDYSITITVDKEYTFYDPFFEHAYVLDIDDFEYSQITINPMPDGSQKTFDGDTIYNVRLKYPSSEGEHRIIISIEVDQWYEFFGWTPDMIATPEIEVVLNSDSSYKDISPVVKWQKCTLSVWMASNGSLIVDTLPDGTTETFDPSRGRSVSFAYDALASTQLTANPDGGYKLIDWGDSAQTKTDILDIVFEKSMILYPTYEPTSTVFKLPSQCNEGNNLKIEGLSSLSGKVEDFNNFEVKGILKIKDSNGGPEECVLSNNSVSLGNTEIRGDSVHSSAVRSNALVADNMRVRGTIKTDTLFSKRLEVTIDSFPDFVFENGYNLLTINELEDSIRKEGRLPGMPSEEQVRENGLYIGDMYQKLLQKLEESMIYIFRLNKEISELESDGEGR